MIDAFITGFTSPVLWKFLGLVMAGFAFGLCMGVPIAMAFWFKGLIDGAARGFNRTLQTAAFEDLKTKKRKEAKGEEALTRHGTQD